MPRVYTKKPPQPCKVDGCTRVMWARGMCNTHYNKWRHATKEKPTQPNSRQLVLDSLPGTFKQIAAAAGLCYETVLGVVNRLMDETPRPIHIDEYRQGGNVTKISRYVAVFALGDFPDAEMPSRLKRKKARLAAGRDSYHRRKTARAGDPLTNALFGRTTNSL